jgi:tetratricopeptide (TPR) repeat protein
MSAENAQYRLEDANDLFSEGDNALSHSRPKEAKSVFESALIYRRVESALGEANCVRRLADIDVRQSRYAAATERYDRASRLYCDLKNTHGEASCRKGMGDLALLNGNLAGAREKYRQTLAVFQTVGDRLGEANCVKGLSDAAFRASDYTEARLGYQRSRVLYRGIRDSSASRPTDLKTSGRPNRNPDETELVQCSHPVGQPGFSRDRSILEPDDAHTAEPHLAVQSLGKGAHDEIVKGGSGVRAFAHPADHNLVTVGDEICRSFTSEIGKRFPKIRHERLERHAANP